MEGEGDTEIFHPRPDSLEHGIAPTRIERRRRVGEGDVQPELFPGEPHFLQGDVGVVERDQHDRTEPSGISRGEVGAIAIVGADRQRRGPDLECC